MDTATSSHLNTQNSIILSKNNLLSNYHYLSSLNPEIKISPVLKSNAYGYGILEIAKILDIVNAPFFCVNSFAEAYILWKNDIKTPILIMGYVDPENLKKEKYPFSYAMYNYDQLHAINLYQKQSGIHIFVDTGMHREGFRLEKLPFLLENLRNFQNIRVKGIMSHLAIGHDPKDALTTQQITTFKNAHELLENSGIRTTWQHIFNSPGLLAHADIQKASAGNVARIGKALYGIDPRRNNNKLKPILKLTSKLVQIKRLNKGDSVGYDATFQAKNSMMLGILPIGYFDGVDRRLSNRGIFLIDGVPCPIVGRVSMNLTTIDVSKVKNPHVGQEVIIFSDQQNDPNSVENIAQLCDTIPYDVVVRLPSTTPRIIAT